MSSFKVNDLKMKLLLYKVGDRDIDFMNDAIKLCNMFESLDQSCRYYDVGMVPQLQLHRIIEQVKDNYFPTRVNKIIAVKAERSAGRIQSIIDTIECIKGVEEVKIEE